MNNDELFYITASLTQYQTEVFDEFFLFFRF